MVSKTILISIASSIIFVRDDFSIFLTVLVKKESTTKDPLARLGVKQAAFESMVFRLCTIPLSKVNFEKELNYIYDTAKINGFDNHLVDRLIGKHQKRLKLQSCSSLELIKDQKKRIAMTFLQFCLKTWVKSSIIQTSNWYRKGKLKLKQLLYSTKGPIPPSEKADVYICQCNNNNCDCVYIGQTRRKLKTRFHEHLKYIENIEPYRSGIAEQSLSNTK